MPNLAADLHQPATIEREVFSLADVAVSGADTTAIAAARASAFFIAVTLTDWTTGAGTVTVHGTLDSAPVSAAQTFSSNTRRIYLRQQFDVLTSIVTTGFAADSGQIQVDAVSRSGQPDEALTVIATNVLCKVTRERFGSLQQSSTEAAIDSARIFFFPEQPIQKKDIIAVDGDRWRVKGVQESFNYRTGLSDMKIIIAFNEEQS